MMQVQAQVRLREQTVFRTFAAKLHVGQPGEVHALARAALAAAVTSVGVAVQRTLERLEQLLTIEPDDRGRVLSADIVFPLQERDVDRARRLVSQPRPDPRPGAGPKEAARPYYRNSYRLEAVVESGGARFARARIAEAFRWVGTRGEVRGRELRELDMIDATIGLQQLIASWLQPDLGAVPKRLRAGVCQQAAQQLLSHLGLLDSGTAAKTSFPSREERDPVRRRAAWENSLAAVVAGLEPFPYARLRELRPGEYADDDPRGDRLVNTDPSWIAVSRSPEALTLPLNFVQHDDVVIYERRWQEARRRGPAAEGRRLYVALPLFEGVAADSPLGQLGRNPALRWWHHRLDEFHPLPAWAGRELKASGPVLVVALEYDPGRRMPRELRGEGESVRRPSRFQSAFTGLGGRGVNWSLLVQRQRRSQPRQTEWEIHFATSRRVTPTLRPNVLGVHFGVDPIVWWALADASGAILQQGYLPGNEILEEGLRQKIRLEQDIRGKLRWLGGRQYAAELKRRTVTVAASIVALAAAHGANLAVEDILWVDKRTGGPDANRRFSLWNYGELRDLIAWRGLERQVPSAACQPEPTASVLVADPVVTIRYVSDYLLRYTCPSCGARREAGEPRERATTWLEAGILHCRPCSFVGVVPDDHQARLVAQLGAEALRRRFHAAP